MFNVLNLLAKCTQLHLEERNARKIFCLKKISTVKHGGGIITAWSCLFAVRLGWKNLGNNSNLYQEILLKKSRQQLTSTRSV